MKFRIKTTRSGTVFLDTWEDADGKRFEWLPVFHPDGSLVNFESADEARRCAELLLHKAKDEEVVETEEFNLHLF